MCGIFIVFTKSDIYKKTDVTEQINEQIHKAI